MQFSCVIFICIVVVTRCYKLQSFYPHDAMLVRSLPSKDVCKYVLHTPVLSVNGQIYFKTLLIVWYPHHSSF